MTYVKIGNTTYPAVIYGRMKDTAWDDRESKTIEIEMDAADAAELFVDGLEWSIVGEGENGPEEYDNSDFTLAGDITDHRDGTVSVKMGKLTDLELAYELLYGGE